MKRMSESTDTELICLFRNGSEYAFRILVQRHTQEIYGAIFLMVRNQFAAEDILQETLVRVCGCIRKNSYAEEGKFVPWALRIARNLCYDHFRKCKRRPETVVMENAYALPVSGSGVAARIVQRQVQEQLHELLQALPHEQRQVIEFRHFEELSFKEIAARTNTSVSTAMGRMRYGLHNLRRMMHRKEFLFQ